jgi:hypothetical protein
VAGGTTINIYWFSVFCIMTILKLCVSQCFSIYNLYYLLAMLTPCCPLLRFAIYHRSCAIVDRTSQWQRTYKRRDQSTGETRHPQ